MIQKKLLLIYEGEPLQAIDYDEDDNEDVEDVEDVEEKKPAKSVKIFDLDKGINDDHKELLSSKNFELPNTILKKRFRC